MNALISK